MRAHPIGFLTFTFVAVSCVVGPEAMTTTATDDPAPTTEAAPTTGAEPTTAAPLSTTEPDATTEPDTDDSTGGAEPCGPACPGTSTLRGDFLVTSRDDMSAFACVTAIEGDLSISGSISPADLAAFANLQTVTGALRLGSNPTLTDLSMFACLRSVDALELYALPMLTDTTALAGVQRARGLSLNGVGVTALPTFAPDYEGLNNITLANNDALADLGPAAAWSAVGPSLEILISSSPALTSIAPLAGLIADNGGAVRLGIWNLPGLASLEGLEAASSGAFGLGRLPLVSDLAPLAGVTSVSLLSLSELPLISSLAGLENLGTADDLEIGFCSGFTDTLGMEGLTSLAGLDSLTAVGKMRLGYNANLAALTGAPALHIAGEIQAEGNPLLTQAAYDAFLAQFDRPPGGCFGGINLCNCSGPI